MMPLVSVLVWIVYRGNASIDNQVLSDSIDIKAGESIDRFRINLARQGIERLYKSKNHPFAHVEVPAELFDCITLSTFHGCPADEIERIAMHTGIGKRIAFSYDNFDNRTMYGMLLLLLVGVMIANGALSAWEKRLHRRFGQQ